MAQTQAEWYAKIKKWVPSWRFEKESQISPKPITPAMYQAIAAVFSRIQFDTDDQQQQTFILDAAAPILDLHGDERSLPRNPSELDPSYASRIQNCLFLPVSLEQLQAVVNGVLNNGPALFIENEEYGFYTDVDAISETGDLFYDDYGSRWLDANKWYDWWTVVIPVQTAGDPAVIEAAIISAIESNKALGTTYDVLYLSTSDTDTDD